MSNKHVSRNSELDIEKCVANAGGNRFDLIIMAAHRSRQIAKSHRMSENPEHIYPGITALLEFQDGKLDSTYLKRVK